jgi:hypothetical protein
MHANHEELWLGRLDDAHHTRKILITSLSRSAKWTVLMLDQFFQVTLAAFVTRYAMVGGTKHLYYLDPKTEMKEVLKWSYVFQCWGIFACTPAKLPVALLINRIMRPFRGWRFWVLVVAMGIMALVNTLDSIFTYVQCNPAKALWDKSITDAKCWDPTIQANISIAQACKVISISEEISRLQMRSAGIQLFRQTFLSLKHVRLFPSVKK